MLATLRLHSGQAPGPQRSTWAHLLRALLYSREQ